MNVIWSGLLTGSVIALAWRVRQLTRLALRQNRELEQLRSRA